jgi:steroid 5-alpha reductase family enzyme
VTGSVLLVSAIAIAALMVTTWVPSVLWRDASIVDPVWPLGFVIVAWVTRAVAAGHGDATRQWILVAMTTLWGLRLSGYLAWRKRGAPEDPRYRAMRRHWGDRFAVVSLLTVFGLQGVLMWIVSLPVQLGQTRRTPEVGVVAVVGVVVWLVGVAFETIGDAQLARFKADPASAGQVMDRGLWRYTRHPNYFGDACVWWGIALVAAETGAGAIGIVGAVVMTVLLLRVSGVPMLERSMAQRRPGYTEYVRRTSAFVPRPPRD